MSSSRDRNSSDPRWPHTSKLDGVVGIQMFTQPYRSRSTIGPETDQVGLSKLCNPLCFVLIPDTLLRTPFQRRRPQLSCVSCSSTCAGISSSPATTALQPREPSIAPSSQSCSCAGLPSTTNPRISSHRLSPIHSPCSNPTSCSCPLDPSIVHPLQHWIGKH